jgi:hypothetical protein
MATVIDSLLIELGLDASSFDKSQKKAVDSLKKFEDQANKANKQNQKGAKDSAESFDKVTESVMKLGVAIFGVAGLKNLITSVTQTNTQLNRQSNMLGMNVNSLQAWGQAVKAMGGNAEDFASSMQNMEGGLTAFSLGLGGEEVFTGLTRLGVGLKNGKIDLLELSKALIKVKEEKGIQAALALSAPLMGADTFYLLTQSTEKTKALIEQHARLNQITQEGAEQSAAFTEKTVALETSMMGLKNSIMGQMYPALNDLANLSIKAMEGFKGLDATLGGAASKVAAFEAVAVPLVALLAAAGVVTLGPAMAAVAATGAIGVAGYGAYNYLTGKSGVTAPGVGAPTEEPTDKSKQSETASKNGKAPLTQRLHNPGAIKDTPWSRGLSGYIGSEQSFAKFKDEESGAAAQTALLNKKASQGMNTLRKLIYGSDGNLGWLGKGGAGSDLERQGSGYLADMVKRTGINPDQVINNWELVRKAQAGHEAGTPNNTNVSTQIGVLNVNTQATNPDGIAKDMNNAIQQRAVIDYGIVGNQ